MERAGVRGNGSRVPSCASHAGALLGRAAFAAALVLLAGRLSLPAAGVLHAAKPNIVFILIDDMGWTDGGCFGSKYYRTPNLDKLAASGMRFTQAYAACAVCSPTRSAIMTGKYPARLHITDWISGEKAPKNSRFRLPDWQQHLPLEETTIAEALKQRGYATAAIGKWHLGGPEFYPQHQGFDLNVAGGDIGSPASYFWPYGATNASHRVPGLAEQGGAKGEYLTDRLTDEALKFITANRDHPFYLYFPHYAVHAPLMGKEEEVEEFRQIPGANGQSNAVYAAMLKSVDQSVGRVLQKLEELGTRRPHDRGLYLGQRRGSALRPTASDLQRPAAHGQRVCVRRWLACASDCQGARGDAGRCHVRLAGQQH